MSSDFYELPRQKARAELLKFLNAEKSAEELARLRKREARLNAIRAQVRAEMQKRENDLWDRIWARLERMHPEKGR